MKRQSKRLSYMLSYLLEEDKKYADLQIPQSTADKKKLFDQLMQARPITSFSKEFNQVYEEYQRVEKDKEQIVSVGDLAKVSPHVYLYNGDPEMIEADALVRDHVEELTGQILSGYFKIEKTEDVPYSNVIYTARESTDHSRFEQKKLVSSYWKTYDLASSNNWKTIAFFNNEVQDPSSRKISLRIAIDTLGEYIRQTRKNLNVVFHVNSEEEKNSILETLR